MIKPEPIEELAYNLIEAKCAGKPGPIFFLGAGASKTGGIPLAKAIVKDILINHKNNPLVKSLNKDELTYAKLMECLSPHARNTLLKGYVDKAKINVTHIYLAQLMANGYADYVLTVNFDNLMLRALALFNDFPSTYDMAILKDLTTTTFKEKSVVYLHGQHHGLWLLNTQDEMSKVNEIIPPILHGIKNERPWVFIGYSGDDPIFEHIQKLGRFDNGLYWVSYNDHEPTGRVKDFLDKPNTNASLVKGYDADSFMLKLNSMLSLPQPDIIVKPFSSVKSLLEDIVDIDDKEHFKGVKERLKIARKQVNTAIQQFEKGRVQATEKSQSESKTDLLKKEIISLMVSENYSSHKIKEISSKAIKLSDPEINSLLASLYVHWGSDLGSLAETKDGKAAESLYQQAFEKYAKAVEINPDNHEAYNNWGTDLGMLAGTESGKAAELLYQEAFKKYAKAVDVKPKDNHEAYYNWGIDLGMLAGTQSDKTAESLYNQAFEKYAKAVEIKRNYHEAYYNWGIDLGMLAGTKSGKAAELLYKQSIEKYKKSISYGGSNYNLASTYALLMDKDNALRYLDNSLKNEEITPDFVVKDEGWLNYLKDEDFKATINRYQD